LWGYREPEAMGGHDPYSSSKGCAELVTAAYRSSFFRAGDTAVASARAGNVIGGGDWAADRLVPDLLRAFAEGRTLTLRNPGAVRPWQHVLEPLWGYLLLAQRLVEQGAVFAEAWNFGPAAASEVPVAQVARKLQELWGNGCAVEFEGGVAGPHEAGLLRLDSSKAAARLPWQPQLSLATALEFTVAWQRQFLDDPAQVRQVTLDQIARYEALCAPGAAA